MDRYQEGHVTLPTRAIMKLVVLTVISIVVLATVPNCVEWLDAKHIMVVQYPNGSLRAFTEPGPAPQWFGTITKYDRRAQFEFDNDQKICVSQKDATGNPPQRIRFAEGGHGHLCGALSWEMPTDHKLLFEIQKDFGSQTTVEHALVGKALDNAIYFSGQMMTSTESAAERRAELLHVIEDQLKNGVYQTRSKEEQELDPLTKQHRTVKRVEILRDAKGRPVRNNESAISKYGIQLVQTSISEIRYEDSVEKQIKDQQRARADVQIAIANALKAEQDARTAAERGKASATEAEWKQKTIAAQEIAKAEQEKKVAETHAAKNKAVAQLEKEAAEFTKQREILLGQGESERRRLVMTADGALEKKLEALVRINELYATAIKDYKGNWVPNVAMGNSGTGSNQGLALVDLLTAKTARDLGVDMGVGGKSSTAK